ncbi:MAG: hypothetical protein EAZ90_22995 [Oscillatoriales cyanobacterium]|nr:MAG: hypothetical protein EAZ94_25505 [Oscillatoriales cyanobacterium]TAE19750.1 MAG: hypothetical protein EAZ93_26245 [Oscillatoriales cyanobacterium]TAE39394.1 MAG: hypothetical protein EAZ90_22995 [Oscillatoriales cyanobacterium]TAE49043.1 MAG: hypothetical protein EAZ88_23110 [Oscillatoriales cyanobacterium]TAE68298.1 MAG: hypothetical protein EAZ86_13995 [Oscillatoriales cyanobacterium]
MGIGHWAERSGGMGHRAFITLALKGRADSPIDFATNQSFLKLRGPKPNNIPHMGARTAIFCLPVS